MDVHQYPRYTSRGQKAIILVYKIITLGSYEFEAQQYM